MMEENKVIFTCSVVPQGSVLGPVFLSLFPREPFVSRDHFSCQCYALRATSPPVCGIKLRIKACFFV